MNPVIELLQQHRSIRKFSEQSISAELLEQILLSGQSAATSSYIQTTTVIQVTDAEKRVKLAELSGNQKYVQTAAEFLVVCADWHRIEQQLLTLGMPESDFSWTEQFITATVDASLFTQNMVTAAQSAGLGCCYIGGIRNKPEQVSKLLALPELVYPVFGLCLGYPDQKPAQKPRLPLPLILKENSYQTDQLDKQRLADYDNEVRAYYKKRTNGRIEHTWTEQMQQQSESQKRPFMKEFLTAKGFMRK